MPLPSQFASQISTDAVNACINTGIFPSVVIAQAIEESGSGSSKLARMFNNLFGHMAGLGWLGKKGQTVPGGKYWRAYNSIGESVAAHIHILTKPKYILAGVPTAKTPFEQVIALQKAGYNTGPDREQYALKLAKIIKGLGLQQYDQVLFKIERSKNNGLTYHEQSPATHIINKIV